MYSSFISPAQSSLFGLALAGGLLFGGCTVSTPEISGTTVTPSSVALSEPISTIQFTIETNVLHMGGTITSVTASVEGEDLVYDLIQVGEVIGGEKWSITTTMTLWEGFAEGVYYIDVTAVSSEGETVTLDHAASVTITS